MAIPAAAQQPNAGPAVAVTYSGLRDVQDEQIFWDRGFTAEFSQPLRTSRTAIVGEFSWNHNTFFDDDLKSYLGGIRHAVWTRGQVQSFVQVLAGTEQCCAGTNGLTLQPGAGVNYWVATRLAVRFQADWRLARYSHDDTFHTYKEARLGVGIVVPFGGR